jgi:hypothetical protein
VKRFQHAEPLRPSIVDPYLPFVREVLDQHPRLRATRIYQMARERGYAGNCARTGQGRRRPPAGTSPVRGTVSCVQAIFWSTSGQSSCEQDIWWQQASRSCG